MSECDEPFFLTRGVVLTPRDIATWSWPQEARESGLNTLATHGSPGEIARFLATREGEAFLAASRDLGLDVEHETHAAGELLPRRLFHRDPAMFRMDERGDRVPDWNLCVHSKEAVGIACQNAEAFARALDPTTGRFFFWTDDARPMCRCPKCRGLSDSDQALLLENSLIGALRAVRPDATLAHLAYRNTMPAPTQVKPDPGIFLEFAPIARYRRAPVSPDEGRLDGRGTPIHAPDLDALDANLDLFGREGARVLEYWLDASMFAGWKRQNCRKIPWTVRHFADDLETYAGRGIRHVATFAAWIDGDYVNRFGEPPLREYGAALLGRGGPGRATGSCR